MCHDGGSPYERRGGEITVRGYRQRPRISGEDNKGFDEQTETEIRRCALA